MKTIAFHNRYSKLDPILFSEPNAPIGDELLLPFNVLAKEASRRGVECVTLDPDGMTPLLGEGELLGIVFIDRTPEPVPLSMAVEINKVGDWPPSYLIAFENPVILPENWTNLDGFAKVFSWAKAETLDPARFVHLNYASRFPSAPLEGPDFLDRKLCSAVWGNKSSPDPRSLYPLRRKMIETFSLHEGFDLFGPGWGLERWATSPFLRTAWKGTIQPGLKRRILSRYRFSLAFENASFPGYVTEKLFDCLIAGTVPVYYGAPDVAEALGVKGWSRLPLIDARKFSGPVEILRYLSKMPEREWRSYREAGWAWMNSSAADPYRIETFCDTILDAILEEAS